MAAGAETVNADEVAEDEVLDAIGGALSALGLLAHEDSSVWFDAPPLVTVMRTVLVGAGVRIVRDRERVEQEALEAMAEALADSVVMQEARNVPDVLAGVLRQAGLRIVRNDETEG